MALAWYLQLKRNSAPSIVAEWLHEGCLLVLLFFVPTNRSNRVCYKKKIWSHHILMYLLKTNINLCQSLSILCVNLCWFQCSFFEVGAFWRCQQFLHQNKIIWWFGSLFDAIDSNCTIWWIKNTASWIILRFQSHVPPKSIPSNSTKLCLCHNYLYQRQLAKEPTFHIGCLEIRIVEHQGGI